MRLFWRELTQIGADPELLIALCVPSGAIAAWRWACAAVDLKAGADATQVAFQKMQTTVAPSICCERKSC